MQNEQRQRKMRWIIGGGVLLALAAGMVTGYAVRGMDPQREASQPVAAVANADPIEEFRTERQQLRQMQITQLNEIIYGGNTEKEIVSMAQRQLLELMSWQEQELTLEGVLRMRAFEDVVVTVHTDSVNVLVRAETLNRQQTAVILELVTRETGVSGGNVKIIPLN